jgi:two-component system cell cycle sensor histidine kinase/response regulator CckA
MAVPSDHDIILALGEDLPVGIWVARAPNGEEVYANRTFQQIMGTGLLENAQLGNYSMPYGICTRDGKPYPESRMPFVRALEEKRVVVSDDITIRRRDGTTVDVRAFSRPVFDADGVITHVVIAFFDITREIEAERAQAESEERLHRAQRLEAIGTLAGGIAHDFNNLIFGIKLIASDLATDELDPKRKAALHMIDDITERSAALTRSLLGFARRGKHRTLAVGLSDVVASMAELLRRTTAGSEIEFDLEAQERGVVIADQSQLEQVIMNLVGNSRDAVAGTGRIRIRTFTMELSGPPAGSLGVATSGRHVVLEISDDGPGIPREIRDRVFEPYFTTKTKGPDRGTGLGLATVYGIIELHKGSIVIDDGIDGRGTTFRVFLPAATRPAEPVLPRGTAAPRHGSGLLLVIDDDAIVRRAVSNALEALGYQTLQASGGSDAVTMFRDNLGSIRGVVLDMVMPGMNGRATYVALREIDPEVRVLLMSGYAVNEEIEEILQLGVRGYLAKPHSVEQLSSAIAEVLGDVVPARA